MFLLNQTKGWRTDETLNNIFWDKCCATRDICHIAGRAKGWEQPGVGNSQQKQHAAMALKKEGGWAGQDQALFSANPRPWHLLVTQKGHVLVFGADVSHALYYLAWRTVAPSCDISCDIVYRHREDRALTRIHIFSIKLKPLDLYTTLAWNWIVNVPEQRRRCLQNHLFIQDNHKQTSDKINNRSEVHEQMCACVNLPNSHCCGHGTKYHVKKIILYAAHGQNKQSCQWDEDLEWLTLQPEIDRGQRHLLVLHLLVKNGIVSFFSILRFQESLCRKPSLMFDHKLLKFGLYVCRLFGHFYISVVQQRML